MLADLYNAPGSPDKAVGAACIGSSEAIMLAGGWVGEAARRCVVLTAACGSGGMRCVARPSAPSLAHTHPGSLATNRMQAWR
jgi:glutamate/tyrosine decarboxylase-like PLP-dependent enzyme